MNADDSRAHVTQMIMGAWATQVAHVAVRLGLPERLAAGPRSSEDLAAETGAHAGALHRLLRAMAVLGLCNQLDERRFELTEAGTLLAPEVPGSMRGAALHWGERLWGALGQLEQSVMTGRAWAASGVEGFQQMVADPAQMAMFHQSMTDQTGPVAQALLQAYDFGRFRRLTDVGGSYGALLAALLKAHPGLEGQVYDLPGLADASAAYLAGQGVADRAWFVGGDFFAEVPAGADAYLLKMIIHDWDDEKSIAILANCSAALGEGGVVLVMERIAPELIRGVAEELAVIRGDMLMLTAAGGMERTRVEYEALFERAGLRLERVIPSASGFSVLEAVAA